MPSVFAVSKRGELYFNYYHYCFHFVEKVHPKACNIQHSRAKRTILISNKKINANGLAAITMKTVILFIFFILRREYPSMGLGTPFPNNSVKANPFSIESINFSIALNVYGSGWHNKCS